MCNSFEQFVEYSILLAQKEKAEIEVRVEIAELELTELDRGDIEPVTVTVNW